jgi:prophage regulatory protein
MLNSQTTPTKRIIRLPELKNQTGKSRSSIYDTLNPKSPRYDSSFPKPARIGLRSIGWYESEVQAWIESRREIGA